GELRLGVLVEGLHVGVRRGGVEVVVALLAVLPVVPLRPRQAEEALLQDRVSPVPEGKGEAEAALPVGDPEQPVLPPPVGAAARLLGRKGIPTRAARGVVLPPGPPL